MKYFLDLEASQYNEKIISIGCVDEYGRTFYSLVRPSSKRVITEFITNLTGLTYDVLQDAPTADKVFSDFCKWISYSPYIVASSEPCYRVEDTFYVYGNADKMYLKNTLKALESFNSKKVCEYIISCLSDYCETTVKKKFNSEIALVTLLSFYRKDYISSQKHNALEDAQWLKEIYGYVEKDENTYTESFSNSIREKYPRLKVEYPKKENKKKPVKKDSVGGKLIAQRVSNAGNVSGPKKEFVKWSDAAAYINKVRASHKKKVMTEEELIFNIKKSSVNGGIYNRYKWTLE